MLSTASNRSPPAAQENGTVLVIEDDAMVREGLCTLLDASGFRVIEVPSVQAAEHVVGSTNFAPSVILADLHLSDGSGSTAFEVLPPFIERIGFGGPVIVISGDTSPVCPFNARRLGWTFLVKPFTSDTLLSTILNSR